MQDVPLEDVPRIWREYFVVGFSRNPWRRAVGTYQFIHRAQVNSSECEQLGSAVASVVCGLLEGGLFPAWS